MRQTVGEDGWWPRDVWNTEHGGGPGRHEQPNYAILDELEAFRHPDGKLELRQSWPGEDWQPQHWKQRSNPYVKRSPGVEGYEAVACPHSSHAWGGLEAGHGSALLNGSIGSLWFYAIGSYQEWCGAIPGPESAAECVELHARRPTGQWVLVMRQTVGEDGWWPRDVWNTEHGGGPGRHEQPNYAILDELEAFRHPDGKLELRQSWPGEDLQPQHWKQRSNPYVKRSPGVEGYEAVAC